MCICNAFVVGDVKLYVVPACEESREAASYLGGKGIRHEIFDTSTDEQALAELTRISTQSSRPVIVIGDRVFIGFNEEELEEVMP